MRVLRAVVGRGAKGGGGAAGRRTACGGDGVEGGLMMTEK